MIELSVMSFVSVIFNYVLRCINGGLLNVAFTPIYNETSKEYTYEFDMDQDRLKKYLKGLLMISGKDLPLEVLKTFPVSIGGGEEGVKEAQDNPNREVIFIIGPVAAAILMLIAIIGLICINFCTSCKECCHGHKGKKRRRTGGGGGGGEEKPQAGSTEAVEVGDNGVTQQDPPSNRQFDNGYDGYAFYKQRGDNDSDSDDSDDEPKGFVEKVGDFFKLNTTTAAGGMVEERQGKIMEKVEEVAQRSEFVKKHQDWFCCGCHIFTLILAIVYVVGLVVCVVVYIMATQQVAEVMGQPPSDENTLKNEVVAWLGNKSNHYNFPGTVSYVLQETIVLLNESSSNLIQTMNKTLDELTGELNTTVEEGATALFNELQNVTGIGKVFNDTFDLSDRLSDLMKSANATAAHYNSTLKNVIDLNATFSQCYSEIKAECQPSNCSIPNADLEILLFKFNQTAVKDPSLLSTLNGIVNKFEELAQQIKDLQKDIAAMPSQLTSNITSKLNFTQQINHLQEQLNGMLNEVKPKIDKLTSQVLQYVDKARPYVSPALYAPAAVMTIGAIIFFACLLLFIAEAFHRRLFAPTGKGPSELAEVSRSKRRSHICGGCRFLICSILFILIVILSLLAAAILVVCSILAVELCPYVYMEKGMNQSDYVLNSILAEKWPAIQQQQGEFLEIEPPKNIIYGLSVTCVPAAQNDPKLLPSVGIDKLANLTKLADTEDFQKQINDSIDSMAKEISGQIPAELIANLGDMKNQVTVIKAALDRFDAEGAVQELKKFTEVDMSKLAELQKKVETELPNKNLADNLKAAIEQLKNNQTDIMDLQNGYQGIANQSALPDTLDKFINETENTLKLLQDEKQLKGILQKDIRPMLLDLMKKLLTEVTDALNGLVSKVLPCGNMHYVFEALVATGCSSSGLVTRFFGWALALTLSTLFSFLSFVGLFNLWCIQSHQLKRFYRF